MSCRKKARRGSLDQQIDFRQEEDAMDQGIPTIVQTDAVMTQFQEWGKEEGTQGILQHALSFLDVVTLVQKKQVSKTWQTLCTKAIDNKCIKQKKIQTNKEIREVVGRYCEGKPSDMEEIATTYRFPIGKMDVSEVEDFSYTFNDQREFNEDINSWDVSKAKIMERMFFGARNFNKPLDQWNTSNVEDMEHMFDGARSFNQTLNTWDTSSVEFMAYMFHDATAFNQPLDTWDTSSVEEMAFMFRSAASFNQPLNTWVTSNVENMRCMFCCATSFNQSLHNWDLSNVEHMNDMLYGATSFDSNNLAESMDADIVYLSG